MAKKKKVTFERANWTEESMEKALKLLQDGHSQRSVSNKLKIPRRTLRNHMVTKSVKRKLGRSAILDKQQETDLKERILRYAGIGLPITPLGVCRSVFQYCEQHKIANPFEFRKKVAGCAWYLAFMQRNTDLRVRRAQNMNMARAQKLNKPIVDDYFKKLGEELRRGNYPPQTIFNMDEKGCRLTIHHQQKVLAKKGARRVHLLANEHAENATVIGCVSAIGQVIPPMILIKGVRRKDTYRGEILLIMDGAKCHLDISICDKAESHNIRLFCLPSNTTHELQPLDKSIFRSFEHHWDDELLTYWQTFPDRTLNKERFGNILTKVWSKCTSLSNVVNGFKATGIYPYNPSAIPLEAFLPSSLTATVQPNGDSSPTTGENSTPTAPVQSDGDSSPTTCENGAPTTPVQSNEITLSTILENTERDPIPSTSGLTNVSATSNDGSDSDSNESPLFKTVLPSPQLTIKQRRPHKKSMNYKAVVLRKELFPTPTEAPKKKTPPAKSMANKSKSKKSDGDTATKKRRVIER